MYTIGLDLESISGGNPYSDTVRGTAYPAQPSFCSIILQNRRTIRIRRGLRWVHTHVIGKRSEMRREQETTSDTYCELQCYDQRSVSRKEAFQTTDMR